MVNTNKIVLLKLFLAFATCDPLFAMSENTERLYWTSVSARRNLIKEEQSLIPALLEYKQALETKIATLKSHLTSYKQYGIEPNNVLQNVVDKNSEVESTASNLESLEDSRSVDTALNKSSREWKIAANPLLCYQLLNRFSTKLETIEMVVENSIAEEKSHRKIQFLNELTKTREKAPIPNVMDRKISVSSILNLARVYKMNPNKLATGILSEERVPNEFGLSEKNLYELADFAKSDLQFQQSIEFYQAALRTLETQNSDDCDAKCFKRKQALMRGLMDAIELHDDNFDTAQNGKDYDKIFTSRLHSPESKAFRERTVWDLPLHKASYDELQGSFYSPIMFNNHERLCRQQYSESLHEKQEEHRCFRYTGGWTGNRLAPLKVEVLHKDPLILQVYDIITAEQADKLMKISEPTMFSSEVLGSQGNDSEAQNLALWRHFHRSSENAWLNDFTGPIDIDFVRKATTGLTGMELRIPLNAELIQVVQYPSGGQYVPHPDAMFFDGHIDMEEEQLFGDRIATMMFYLNNVTSGGATAFPFLGVVARPVPRSGLFWFNLHSDTLKPDVYTVHGGCPVTYGEKWIATKWIRSHGQMPYVKCAPQRNMKNYHFEFLFSDMLK